MTNGEEINFVSIRDAAQTLGISVQGVWKSINSGNMKASRIGRTYIISLSQIEKMRAEKIRELEKQLAHLKSGRK